MIEYDRHCKLLDLGVSRFKPSLDLMTPLSRVDFTHLSYWFCWT